MPTDEQMTATRAGDIATVLSPTKRAGHTLSVLQKVDGRWLLARDANMLTPVEA
jgi:hypothetical protein